MVSPVELQQQSRAEQSRAAILALLQASQEGGWVGWGGGGGVVMVSGRHGDCDGAKLVWWRWWWEGPPLWMGLTWSAESVCGATCSCFLVLLRATAEGGDVGELIGAREKEEVNVVAAQREEGVGVSQAVLLFSYQCVSLINPDSNQILLKAQRFVLGWGKPHL